jgi:MGT family glycosyltransferase
MQRIKRLDNIAVISIPTSGHVHVLAKMLRAIKQDQPDLHIKWILTSWPDFKMNPAVKELVAESCDELITLYGETPQGLQLFERACELTDDIIEQCQDCSHLIYDFLSPEGYLAGKVLKIPAICSHPAIIGPFDPKDPDYLTALQAGDNAIKQLEKKYALTFKDKIQYISAALSIQSDDLNIIFSWPHLIEIGQFRRNREHYNYQFIRSCLPGTTDLDEFKFILDKKAAGKKIVYFSLGTIASSINQIELLNFFVHLYDCLIHDFGRKTNGSKDYEVILSFGDKAAHIAMLRNAPNNFHVYNYLPQEALLQAGYIDIFITHGGGNGANEAIDARVPMIVIPLMFDQHLCAENIAKLGVGISFIHFNTGQQYFRKSLYHGVLKDAVHAIFSQSAYLENLDKVRSVEPLPFTALPALLLQPEPQLSANASPVLFKPASSDNDQNTDQDRKKITMSHYG